MILKFDFQRDEVSFFFLLSHPTALSCIAGVDHGLQLKHRQSVLPPQIRQRWSVPSPRPPRCPVTFSASWYNAPSRNGQSRTSGRTSLPVFRLPNFRLEVKHQLVLVGVNRQPGNSAQPLASQFQIGAAIGVEQLFFSNVSFIGLYLRIKKGPALCRPDVIITPRENAGFAERPHRGHNTSRA